MRTDALRSQRGGKAVFNAGMRLIEGVSEWIFEMYEAEKNVQWYPGKWRSVQMAGTFAILGGLSLLSTIPLLGAVSTGYELYRLADRIVHKARRPSYYDAEAKKRFEKIQAQRSKCHRVRHRSSLFHPPAPEELLTGWKKASARGNVTEKLRLGAMLAHVEAAVNNDLIRDETGEIVGRNPGIRGWLKENCPELLPHYKALMHYKAMADKEQMVCGLADPYPAEVLFAEPFPMSINGVETISGKVNTLIEITVGPKSCWGGKRKGKALGERIEIMVGPDSGRKEKLVLRGVRKEMGEWVRWDVGRVGEVLHRAREMAACLHDEARKAGAASTAKRYEDILFSRLGLIRETRVRPRRPRRCLRPR